MFAQIPNFISLARILMVPLIVVLLNEHQYPLSLLVFTLAGISDGVDGWIAKAYNLQSNFGAMLDAVADKLLLVSTYAMLTMLGDLPFWLLVLVGFRDVTIVGGYFLLAAMDKKVTIKPIWISKLNTFCKLFWCYWCSSIVLAGWCLIRQLQSSLALLHLPRLRVA